MSATSSACPSTRWWRSGGRSRSRVNLSVFAALRIRSCFTLGRTARMARVQSRDGIGFVAASFPVLEERKTLLVNMHVLARSRVAARASLPMLDRKYSEATQLNPVAARERVHDLVEDGARDIFDVALQTSAAARDGPPSSSRATLP